MSQAWVRWNTGELCFTLHSSSRTACTVSLTADPSVVEFTPHCQSVGRVGGFVPLLNHLWNVQRRPRTQTRIIQPFSFSCYQEKTKAMWATKDEFIFSSGFPYKSSLVWHSHWGDAQQVLGSSLPFASVPQSDIHHISFLHMKGCYIQTEKSHKQSFIRLFTYFGIFICLYSTSAATHEHWWCNCN